MSYEKQNFVKGQILKADHLNHMEDGIAAAAVGVQGPKGDKGDVGPQGPKGDKGDTGPAATLDPTLSVSGNAADAKATGDAVSQLREDLVQLSEAKADKEFVINIFEQLKVLIEAGKTDESIAVLDEAILDLAILA